MMHITVSGEPHAGATATALVVLEALRRAGYKVTSKLDVPVSNPKQGETRHPHEVRAAITLDSGTAGGAEITLEVQPARRLIVDGTPVTDAAPLADTNPPITCRVIPLSDSPFGDRFPDAVLADLAAQINARMIPITEGIAADGTGDLQPLIGTVLNGTAKAAKGELTCDVRLWNTPHGRRFRDAITPCAPPITLSAIILRSMSAGEIDPDNLVLASLNPLLTGYVSTERAALPPSA